MSDGSPEVGTPRRALRCAGLLFGLALALPSAAAASSFDHAFAVVGLQGTVTATVDVLRAAGQETPPVQLYDGAGTVRLALQPHAAAPSPAGRLRWNPGRGGSIAVPALLRFGWQEATLRGDVYGTTTHRCKGRSAKATPRRLVHVLGVERQGATVRVRWAIPLPRLGKAGCPGAGVLPRVVGEDLFSAATFDHATVRLGVTGSDRIARRLPGRLTQTTRVGWDFTITLRTLSD